MSIFYPTAMFRRISDIQPETLEKLGVLALILDIDNTLTTHNNPVPDKEVLMWLRRMRKAGIRLVIASNNNERRVRNFARNLGLNYVSRAMKPLPIGFSKISNRLGLSPEKLGIVGDQIFTDILGGNIFGAKTFLVQPMQPEDGPLFRLKRKLEIPILESYRKKY